MAKTKPFERGETLRLRLRPDEDAQNVDVYDSEFYREKNMWFYKLMTQKGEELYLSHEEIERLRH
jgi:hypothetical protein